MISGGKDITVKHTGSKNISHNSHFQFELASKTGTLQLIGNSISLPINIGGLQARCIVLTAIRLEFCLELIIACQNLHFFTLNA